MRLQNKRSLLYWLPALLLLPLAYMSLEVSVQSGRELRGVRDIAAQILPISLISPQSGIKISYKEYREMQLLYKDRGIEDQNARILRFAILRAATSELASEFGIKDCSQKELQEDHFAKLLDCLEKIEKMASRQNKYQDISAERLLFAEHLIERGVAFTDIAQQYGEIYYAGSRRATLPALEAPDDFREGEIISLSNEDGHFLVRLISREDDVLVIESLGYPPATKGELLANFLRS